jgi:hypothetical protein
MLSRTKAMNSIQRNNVTNPMASMNYFSIQNEFGRLNELMHMASMND